MTVDEEYAMDQGELNPIYVVFLYILRCGVPLALMLGVSYLLRRFGLIRETPPAPKDWNGNNNDNDAANGGLAHGKA